MEPATSQITQLLEEKIQDLLYTSLQEHNIRDDDAVSLKTLKLMLVGKILECYGLDWSFLINLFKTHTPVHPEMVRELQISGGVSSNSHEEDVKNTLAQVFVRNEKLTRLLKVFIQNGKNIHQLLAIDGLGAPTGINFDPKHYVGNLRYGSGSDTFFDNKGPEWKRVHVQTVRRMYDQLDTAPVPEKQVYEILRRCFEEVGKVKMPKLEWEAEELMVEEKSQGEMGRFYMAAMGRENIQNFIKSTCWKRFRGEKRTVAEEEECEKPES